MFNLNCFTRPSIVSSDIKVQFIDRASFLEGMHDKICCIVEPLSLQVDYFVTYSGTQIKVH